MNALYKRKGASELDRKAPNKFWFVAPEGIIDKKDIPAYAGLYVIGKYNQLKKIKEAPFLHKTKLRPERTFKKLYYLYRERLLQELFPEAYTSGIHHQGD